MKRATGGAISNTSFFFARKDTFDEMKFNLGEILEKFLKYFESL